MSGELKMDSVQMRLTVVYNERNENKYTCVGLSKMGLIPPQGERPKFIEVRHDHRQ